MNDTLNTIRIFVGTEPKTEIARKVLEVSIRRRTEHNIQIVPMIGKAWEYARDIPVGTGFSLRRWMIAAHCQWQGLAIYLDADQLVFGDVGELIRIARSDPMQPTIWCTHQPDKFSPSAPVPQTSVMVIDCAAARGLWGFEINRVVEHLRANPDKTNYARFMHAEWIPKGRIGTLPVEWNHLNVHSDGKGRDGKGRIIPATRLLHYTSEPTQPWYKPDHPLAKLWQQELILAMRRGAVTVAEIEAALAQWNVKEAGDWRSTNGLHPSYRTYLDLATRKPSAPPPKKSPVPSPALTAEGVDPRVLWVTSFDRAIFDASGRQLVDSFLRSRTTGDLLCCTEGEIRAEELASEGSCVFAHPLGKDRFLTDWLARNASVIPHHLGGQHDGKCRCRGGPFPAHDKRHRQPCIGQWFNRNAARWFRKIASLRRAVELATSGGHTLVIWIDADCVFKAGASGRAVAGWFRIADPRRTGFNPSLDNQEGFDVFYLKSKRPVIESGIVGFNLGGRGGAVLDAVFERFTTGRFRQDERWDDSFQFQRAISSTKGIRAVDLATAVGKDHADVVPHSPLGAFITHDKGRHSRKLGIVT